MRNIQKIDDKKDLIEIVREACNQISDDTVFNLFESFQRRKIKLIEYNRDRNSY